MNKKVILVDFDGTLNSYKSGFERGRPWHLPDPPNPGAIAFLRSLALSTVYEPVIFTTRVANLETGDDDARTVSAIRDWLAQYKFERVIADRIRITSHKVPCSLIIDDNAWRFEGRWPDATELIKLTRRQ